MTNATGARRYVCIKYLLLSSVTVCRSILLSLPRGRRLRLRRHHRPRAFLGEQFDEEGVGSPTSYDVRGGNPGGQCGETGFDFGDHSAGDHALADEAPRILRLESREHLAPLPSGQYTWDVGQQDELARTQRRGQCARGVIGIQVETPAICADADRGDDGNVPVP